MNWKNKLSLFIGIIISILFYLGNVTNLIETLLIFSGSVLLPLILNLAEVTDRFGRKSRLYNLTLKLHPLFSVLLIFSFLLDGEWRLIVAGGWLLYTLWIGLNGLIRILKRGLLPLEELAIDISLLYLPLGGFWFFAYMANWEIAGFSSTIILLTAIHFHYSSLVSPVFVGLIGRMLPKGTLIKMILVLTMISPMAIAIGITYSPVIEFLSVSIFSLTLVIYAFMLWVKIAPRVKSKLARLLLSISGLSILVSMTSAVIYGYGELINKPILDIYQMVLIHGITNAFGFSFAGSIGWSLEKPEPVYKTGIPFSQLMGKGRIGADFFDRNHLKTNQIKNGLVDNMDEFQTEDFKPDALPHDIRSFYESTGDYELLVHPYWKWGFRTALLIFKRFSVKIEQMNFPLQNETGEEKMESHILSINDQHDGRKNVRAWIRTYSGTGLPIYVAAYSTHSYRNQTYMNIAFPLPYSNLTSILRLDYIDEQLILTSLPNQIKGDEGVYLVTKWGPVRLPINETIRVWTADHAPFKPAHSEITVMAKHDMWIFGINFLTLRYHIYPNKEIKNHFYRK